MEYSDGKNHEKESQESLEQLLNIGSNNPYGTSDTESFQRRLASMRLEEKGNLACKVGVQVTTRGPELDRRLTSSFERYLKNQKQQIHGFDKGGIEKGTQAYKDIEHLLGF